MKDWVELYKQCKKRVPLWYDVHLRCLPVGHLWQSVGIDISYRLKMETRYYQLVTARKYLMRWAEAQPPRQGTLKQVTDYLCEMVICLFGTQVIVVVDGGRINKKWTALLLKHCNIQRITVAMYHTTVHGLFQRGHRPMSYVRSKLTACFNVPNELWID